MSTERAIQAAIVRVDMFIERTLPVARILLGVILLACCAFVIFAVVRRIKRKGRRCRKQKRRKKNVKYREGV